jgi:hypothetical protein
MSVLIAAQVSGCFEDITFKTLPKTNALAMFSAASVMIKKS